MFKKDKSKNYMGDTEINAALMDAIQQIFSRDVDDAIVGKYTITEHKKELTKLISELIDKPNKDLIAEVKKFEAIFRNTQKQIEKTITDDMTKFKSSLVKHLDSKIDKISEEAISKITSAKFESEVSKRVDEKLATLKGLL